MTGKKVLGWFVTLSSAWFLLSGVISNDMGGIIALGHSPDFPLTYGREPGRFILGVVVYAVLTVAGIGMLLKADDAEADAPGNDRLPPRERW